MSEDTKIIMYIEDNDDHAELVSEAISQINLQSKMIRFCDAESGLDYLFGYPQANERENYPLPGLILLDISLPGMSGLSFLKQIRANKTTLPIPVIILTTSDYSKDIDMAYQYGANSYIVKPIDTIEFIIKLTELNMYWSLTSEMPIIN